MAAVEKDLSESKRQLAKANERNHNQQKAEENLKQENEQLREELQKVRNFRHDRQQNSGNDPEESSHPCSFLWSWISRSHNSAESNLHRKIHWDQGNLFCKISSMLQVCYILHLK